MKGGPRDLARYGQPDMTILAKMRTMVDAVRRGLAYVPVVVLYLVLVVVALAIAWGFLRQILGGLYRIDTWGFLALVVVYVGVWFWLKWGADELTKNPTPDQVAVVGGAFFLLLLLCMFIANVVCTWFDSVCAEYTPYTPDYSPWDM